MKDQKIKICNKCDKKLCRTNMGELCRRCRMLGNKNTFGWKMSSKQKKDSSQRMMAENNPNWKGDKVGLNGLHIWLKRRLKKPKNCQKCKINNVYDLANKGIYDRNFNNWEWLCRKCHMKSDGRIDKLSQMAKNTSKETREKIGMSNRGRKQSKEAIAKRVAKMSGEKHPLWKGGITRDMVQYRKDYWKKNKDILNKIAREKYWTGKSARYVGK